MSGILLRERNPPLAVWQKALASRASRYRLQAVSELDVPDSQLQNCCRQTGPLDTQNLKHHGWKGFNTWVIHFECVI